MDAAAELIKDCNHDLAAASHDLYHAQSINTNNICELEEAKNQAEFNETYAYFNAECVLAKTDKRLAKDLCEYWSKYCFNPV